jgi:hypothetical protein
MTSRPPTAARRIILLAAVAAVCAAAGAGCGRFAIGKAAAPQTVLRVGTSGDYAPFSVRNEGALEGFDVDAAKRLAEDLGMPVEFLIVPWPTLSAATEHTDFDIAMGGITMRADRALVGRFTRPYAAVGIVALVREAYVERFGSAEALNTPACASPSTPAAISSRWRGRSSRAPGSTRCPTTVRSRNAWSAARPMRCSATPPRRAIGCAPACT